jgi:serine/threonine protein kinase
MSVYLVTDFFPFLSLQPVTIHYKVNFALQIASAMHFLSEEGIVHPDLALRNCL